MPLPPAAIDRREAGGFSGSLDSISSRAGMETSRTVREIAAHYERHIVSAGWTVVTRGFDADRMAVTWFQGKTASGAPVSAVLAATAFSPTYVDLELRVVRVQSAVAPAGTGRGAPALAGRAGGGGASAARAVPGVSPEMLSVLAVGPRPGGAAPAVKAGTHPDFPAELLPTGATVVGHVVESHPTVVAEAPRYSIAAVPEHIVGLRSKGWRDVSPSRIERGGFIPALPYVVELCRGDTLAELEFVPRERPGVAVRAAVLPASAAANTRCRIGGRAGGTPPAPADGIVLPLLVQPPGSVGGARQDGGGGLTLRHFQTRFVAKVPFPAIANHYASQMTSAGWRLDGRVDDPARSVTRFMKTGASGPPVTAFLTLATMASSADIDASFRATWLPPR
jgi:hypothetical protein